MDERIAVCFATKKIYVGGVPRAGLREDTREIVREIRTPNASRKGVVTKFPHGNDDARISSLMGLIENSKQVLTAFRV